MCELNLRPNVPERYNVHDLVSLLLLLIFFCIDHLTIYLLKVTIDIPY